MRRVAALLALIVFLPGCTYYKVTTIKHDYLEKCLDRMVAAAYPEKKYRKIGNDSLRELLLVEKMFYVYDSAGKWLLKDLVLTGIRITAKAEFIDSDHLSNTKLPENRKNMRYNPEKEKYITNRINLYLDHLNTDSTGMTMIFPSDILKCEVYAEDRKKTFWRGFGFVMGPAFALFLFGSIAALSGMYP